ncbi:MAG: ribonuclease domain-containing protein [Propionibacteriaceae bacterium]
MSTPAAGQRRRTPLVRVATAGLIVVVTVLGWLLVDGTGSSHDGAVPAPTVSATDPATGLRWVELSALPSEVQTTVGLIDAGGPFPYRKDGVVFGNRERQLPPQASGYYHEYTVRTPGAEDRGARRIVTGDSSRQLFYTDDHYASFRRIRR